MSEDAWLAEALSDLPAVEDVVLGIGDDAAVLSGGVVLATDALVDGVHFEVAACGGRAAARKALAVNLSDLAAMGARPRGCLVAAVLPRPVTRGLFDDLMAGFRETAEAYACPLLGGDTNSADGPLVLAVTVIGRAPAGGAVTRAGARVGDVLSVTGPLGGSRAGRHLVFEPRLQAGRALADTGVAHAMMDLSDGLGRDLPRMCRASGVGAVLEAEAVPQHADAGGEIERALFEGEDFELLVAHAALDTETRGHLEAAGVVLTPIGRIVAEAGIVLREGGRERPLPERGFDHLAG